MDNDLLENKQDDLQRALAYYKMLDEARHSADLEAYIKDSNEMCLFNDFANITQSVLQELQNTIGMLTIEIENLK